MYLREMPPETLVKGRFFLLVGEALKELFKNRKTIPEKLIVSFF